MKPPCRLLPELPDPHGFAGMFGGVASGALLCAGGANFSARPLAQGGKRVWHDRIFALEDPEGPWGVVGRLPRPLGYGVSGTWRDAVVIAGGMDADGHRSEAWLLRRAGGAVVIEALPDLPIATANPCGAVVGDQLYVAGGQGAIDSTPALARAFVCDLAAAQRRWLEIPWPEEAPGRILAVAGAADDAFHLFSGAALLKDVAGKVVRTYLTDAWRYRPGQGWNRLPDLPRPAAAAPNPAWRRGPGEWAILGGIWPEYLAAAEAAPVHPGFSGEVLTYSERTQAWRAEPWGAGVGGVRPRLVAPAVPWRGGLAVVSGEIAPGFRTPGVEWWT